MPASALRIGLFGGTFNPPHVGHLMIAGEARVQHALDKVIFIPCRISPHRTGEKIASARHRVAMLASMLEGQAWAEISQWETRRTGPSFSYMTAEAMAGRNKGASLFWIMGGDQWAVINDWKYPARLAKAVSFLVYPRPQISKKGMPCFSMKEIKGRVDIAASEIRLRIASGKDWSHLVSPGTARYIQEHKLYL